jgi:hypothetical protein
MELLTYLLTYLDTGMQYDYSSVSFPDVHYQIIGPLCTFREKVLKFEKENCDLGRTWQRDVTEILCV